MQGIQFLRLSLSLLFLIILLPSSDGQFGVRVKYQRSQFSDLEQKISANLNENGGVWNIGFEAGLDYWFRLNKQRIEFMPEVSIGRSVSTFSKATLIDATANFYQFQLHTHIYPMDFRDNCNCPTFSRQGAGFEKGFFIHITPGLMYQQATFNFDDRAIKKAVEPKFDQTVFKFGAGAGVDIGFSDLFTLTPIVSYYMATPLKYEFIGEDGEILISSSTIPTILQFSLRLGFRPDYTGRFRR